MDIKAEPFGHTVKGLAQSPVKHADAPPGASVSALAHEQKSEAAQEPTAVSAKVQLNQSILQASMEVNIGAGNEPMALLFKTALEGINQALKGELGDNAIQKAYDEGLDVSPQATADRIVKMSTAFFEQYHAQHTELSKEDALNAFVGIIGGGIDQGFKEARNILGGLKVLDQGDIGSNIDKTYDLVQKALKAFVENYHSTDATSKLNPNPTEAV